MAGERDSPPPYGSLKLPRLRKDIACRRMFVEVNGVSYR
jgi:hypothetical protein